MPFHLEREREGTREKVACHLAGREGARIAYRRRRLGKAQLQNVVRNGSELGVHLAYQRANFEHLGADDNRILLEPPRFGRKCRKTNQQ
ncbi:hypothetical protein DAH81_25315, partial [Sphingomonas koreensis]